MLLISTLTLLLGATISFAARISVSIPPSPPQLPNPATLPASTHAVLLGPLGVRYDALLRRDNTFHFPNVDEASYLLTIHSRDHLFPPLRIDVGKGEGDPSQQTISAWQTFRGNEWSNKGPHYGTGDNVLNVEVRPMAQKDFYVQRGGFNVLSFLKSPMILMSLVSVVMIFGLPKLLDNSMRHQTLCCHCILITSVVDPETKAEMEEMQKKGPITGADTAANTSMSAIPCITWFPLTVYLNSSKLNAKLRLCWLDGREVWASEWCIRRWWWWWSQKTMI
jgi:hypothetical protein